MALFRSTLRHCAIPSGLTLRPFASKQFPESAGPLASLLLGQSRSFYQSVQGRVSWTPEPDSAEHQVPAHQHIQHHLFSPPVPSRFFIPSGTFTLSQAYAQRSYASSTAPENPSVSHPPTPAEVQTSPSGDGSGTASVIETVRDGAERVRQGGADLWASLPPSVQEMLNPNNPYFVVAARELGLLSVVLFTWFKMPRWFRRLHNWQQARTLQTPVSQPKAEPEESVVKATLLSPPVPFPYEQSIWAAAEEPARLLVTVGAMAHLIGLLAPHALPPEYLSIAWRGAAVGSWLWFMYRYKNTWFARAKTDPKLSRAEKDRYVAAERLSTVALVVLGSMSVAETTGVAVQSILTVGGIGGVATAFAARDILGNFLNGAALYLYTPFSIGDNIKAGSLEGTVVDIGLHSTHLVDQDKHSVVVPNTYFSNQVITNRSRTEGRLLSAKIPLPAGLIDRAPELTAELREYLRSRPEIATGKEAPKVYLSSLGNAGGGSLMPEISLTCHTNVMSSSEHGLLLEHILYRAARLVEDKQRESR